MDDAKPSQHVEYGINIQHINVFEIPDILISIFDALCYTPRPEHFRTLLSCTLVHSTWHDEANRRLWNYCGKNHDVLNVPTIEDLLKLDDSVRQRFVNYIRCIYISNIRSEGRERWQGQHLPRLASLSFPNLKQLHLWAPDFRDHASYQMPVLTQFTQPNLRTVQTYGSDAPESFGITEEWMSLLLKHSPHISHFHLTGRNNNPDSRISSAIFLAFIENMRSLESLEWKADESMSKTVFMAMARSTSLRCLRITSIADVWLQNDFQIVPTGRLFENLAVLACGISANTMDQLVDHLSALTILKLRISDGTTQILKTLGCSTLKGLERLLLQPPDADHVHARDLVKLAKNLPRLRTLCIGSDDDLTGISFPIIHGFNDGIMEDMAPLLPNLQLLCLISARNTGMTERSLLSLRLHCPGLIICSLTAAVDYRNLVKENDRIQFKRLEILSVYGFGTRPESIEERAMSDLSRRVRKLMPALKVSDLQENRQLERALNDLIRSEEV